MKLTAKLPLLTLLLTLSPGLLLAAEGKNTVKSLSFKPGQGSSVTLPKSAVPGSTPERRAALQRLTPEQRQEFARRFAAIVNPALEAGTGSAGQEAPAKPRFVRGDLFGDAIRSAVPSGEPAGAPSFTGRSKATLRVPAEIAYSGPDEDGDGLPDDFESAVGDGFTPLYGVSGGEQAGTGFARFGDSSSLSIIQNLPAVPPASHYRVTPVGFAYGANGQQYGFLQIDYLTLWNRDDGLDIGNDCRFYASVLGGLIGYGLADALDGAGPHEFDEERAAALVAAPTPAPFQYSSDPDTYQAYDYYTAAHENTFFDHSGYLGLSQPVPVNNHLNLALSRSKHGTYTFNPDGLPLFPDWVIATTYFTIDDLYYNYYIDDYQYLIYLGMADALFYSCVVEHFQNQGGSYADPRINVGELSHTLNGSGFIHDPRVQSKLTPLLWVIQ